MADIQNIQRKTLCNCSSRSVQNVNPVYITPYGAFATRTVPLIARYEMDEQACNSSCSRQRTGIVQIVQLVNFVWLAGFPTNGRFLTLPAGVMRKSTSDDIQGIPLYRSGGTSHFPLAAPPQRAINHWLRVYETDGFHRY